MLPRRKHHVLARRPLHRIPQIISIRSRAAIDGTDLGDVVVICRVVSRWGKCRILVFADPHLLVEYGLVGETFTESSRGRVDHLFVGVFIVFVRCWVAGWLRGWDHRLHVGRV